MDLIEELKCLIPVVMDIVVEYMSDCVVHTSDNEYHVNSDEVGDIADIQQIYIHKTLYLINTVNLRNTTIIKGDVVCAPNMRYMFFKSVFNQPINHWDVSRVTNASCMFYESKFNQPLEWNTARVTNMSCMFYGSDFNQPLLLNTTNVTNMSCMFNSSMFNYPIIIRGDYWNTSNVTNMSFMFYGTPFVHPMTLCMHRVTNACLMFTNRGYSDENQIRALSGGRRGNPPRGVRKGLPFLGLF